MKKTQRSLDHIWCISVRQQTFMVDRSFRVPASFVDASWRSVTIKFDKSHTKLCHLSEFIITGRIATIEL
jgi:hypothetical protein